LSFIPFELERWQSRWEHRVKYNLSESGVDPFTTSGLLALDGRTPDTLLDMSLGYAQGNGSDELRDGVANLYNDARRENVVITTGSAEANFLICWALIQPGDEVAILMPSYMQTWGIVQNLGATVKDIPLRHENGWEPLTEDIENAIGPKTKLVVVTNPNNPTGHILDPSTLETIVRCASAVGAWVLADEVYQGAELSGETTESLRGSYEKILVTSSLSKAYGLPGLRIGWVVGPTDFIENIWERHDYTVICPTPTGDHLAQIAINRREEVLTRTRTILRSNYALLKDWLNGLDGLLDWTPTEAGAICLVQYKAGPEPDALAEELRVQHNILIVPGNHFKMGRYIRIGIGNAASELEEALGILGAGITAILDPS
jgi:aspartate/methionine/tyrosine aminotransferase